VLCGGSLIAGRCLPCDARRWAGLVHREIVLLAVLVGVAAAAFALTRAVAASNEELRRREAAMWFDTGGQALRAGRLEPAVTSLRRAVARDRGNRQYRLALAGALAESQRDDEARDVLLAMREAQPEDPETNLQLARLEARGPDLDAARRYYQNALAGLWRPERADERRRVRLELIDFLLAHDQRARALSELLVAAANLPEDSAGEARLGRLFLQAGDPRRALDHFTQVLRRDPRDATTLVGAGEAAFELGDYARARRYLAAAPAGDARVEDLRNVARDVIEGDPLAARIGPAERRRRLTTAFEQAGRTLTQCAPATEAAARVELESLDAEARAFAATLRRARGVDRDLIEDGLDLIVRIETAVEQRCGAPAAALDRALLLIGRRHGLGDA
jgi:tetratricopeptide (TPR) repeat protein